VPGGRPIISPAEIADKHTRHFLERHGDLCAATRCNWRQVIFFALCLAAIALGFIRDFKIAYTALTFALCGFYGVLIFFRLISVGVALVRVSEHRVTPAELSALQDDQLPSFTVLVPMYKEPEVAQKIIQAVSSLDYPQDKLDVKLLLEDDDAPTRAKVEEVGENLPACVEVVVVPPVPKGQPKTKPRACNWGLERARGEYLVIFDAEDQPEPDQLKKAIVVFRKLEAAGKSSVACLQAKLNYFNARQNALTRFFTLEYTNWFDLFLPGLHAVRTPIPLGGTSNHFRTSVLQQVGGWDPFNVTEDCDLGIRLTRQGYTTEILDSTTWEEANCQVGNWVRQRSRWIKGYFQTHLVHTRDAVLPFLVLAAVFFALAEEFTPESGYLLSERVVLWVQVLRVISGALGVVAVLCFLFSLYKLLTRKTRRFGEMALGPWKALTFRFTVGGLSAMLILNLFFWMLTGMYLLHEPLARALPQAVAEIRVDETTSLRKAVADWRLYYDNVTDERFAGATVWNTFSRWMGGQFSWRVACDHWGAIDRWSLVSQMFYPVAVMLFAANLVFILLGLISCHKRGLWDLLPFALLVPFYWILISLAALKGFYQLFTNPWYWEKTVHGLDSPPRAPRPPVATGAVSGK
jgi:cellulose synthase/poly-beta-1,6-N-acetylglucosamine synthase-like glycosyltransferase